jgi:hypothetical protein
MRNMSYALTTQQILDRTKDVTRRDGWKHLRVGERFKAVRKAMGFKKGERMAPPIAILEAVDVRREKLRRMTDDPEYGRDECRREGFGDHPTLCEPGAWVAWYCKGHRGVTPETEVTRIEFRYVEDEPATA